MLVRTFTAILRRALPSPAGLRVFITALCFSALCLPDPVGAYETEAGVRFIVYDRRGPCAEVVSLDALVAAAEDADFVLLGEAHHSPAHHLLQAGVVARLVIAGKTADLVFEMIPIGIQGKLDAYTGDSHGLGAALLWEERGWPDWTLYEPIARIALANSLKLRAGGIDKRTIDRFVNASAGRNFVYSATGLRNLREKLQDTHAGLLSPEQLDRSVQVQKARDLAMVMSILSVGQTEGAILIAGNDHVRKDWGVPSFLAQAAPSRRVVSVGQFDMQDEIVADCTTDKPYDFVILSSDEDRK